LSYLEDKVEERLGEGLAALFSDDRYFYFKFKPAGIIGVPDRILIVPGAIMFIELKKPDGKRAPWQTRMHDKLRRLGCWIETLYSLEEVEAFLAHLRQHYA
jgi:hypothetical protein